MDDESGESMELMEVSLLTVAQQERAIGAFPPPSEVDFFKSVTAVL